MARLGFYVAVLGVAIMPITFSSCGKDPITSWNSPRMLALKREWDLLLKNPPKEQGLLKNDKLIKMQGAILRNLSRSDMRHLAATCGMLPVRETEPDEFEFAVLRFMVRTFIDDGDRESLVILLSTRFQEYVGGERSTTYHLLHSRTRALKDPILVLGEAYSRCEVPEVRADIAATVRRGFEGFDIPGKDDAEFVKNAMQWYEREKPHLTVRERFSARYRDTFFEHDRLADK